MIDLAIYPSVWYDLYKFFFRFILPLYSSLELEMTDTSTTHDQSSNWAVALLGAISLPTPVSSSCSPAAHLSQG